MEWGNGSQLVCTEILQQQQGVVQDWRQERGKGREKGGNGDTRVCWSCGKTGHIAANCTKGNWNRSPNAVDEYKGNISKEIMKTKVSCMLGVCWRRARTSNGKTSTCP